MGADAEPRAGFWDKLKRGLSRSHTDILERVGAAVSGRTVVDEELLEELEEVLIGADLGVETSLELVERLRTGTRGVHGSDVVKLRQMVQDEVAILLLDSPRSEAATSRPRVSMMVGVNGVGKTTSIAKLARRSLDQGETVLLVAADTFRAAAIEQLETWAERLGVGIATGAAGTDPASIVYEGLQRARREGTDHVIVDTAGRLHTKGHLMDELAKCKRVVDREASDWARQTILVLDATTGQNAIGQAREFRKSVDVDGVLLAKIDGTAKGGIVVAIARELRLPVMFLGVGEGADDLIEFRPREFASALLG